MKKTTLLILSLLFIVTASLFAQDEGGDYSVLVTGAYNKTVEFAHSKTHFDYMMVTASVQKKMSDWWALRAGIRPVFYARSNVDERDNFGGMGFSLAWVGYWPRSEKVTPYAEFTAGAVLFDEVVPVYGARKFNFSLGIGTGMEIPVNESGNAIVGYRFGHISNSNTADRNPGVNGHTIVLGYRYLF